VPLSVSTPDGKHVDLDWTTNERCTNYFNNDGTMDCEYDWRLGGASNAFRYRVAFAYATDTAGRSYPPSDWYRRTGASFYNDVLSASL
jgi:hypothetical protein